MRLRTGKRGQFFGCARYPDCTYTTPLRAPTAEETVGADHPDLLPEPLRGGEPITFTLTCAHCGRRSIIRGTADTK